jgi:hypothetical protein
MENILFIENQLLNLKILKPTNNYYLVKYVKGQLYLII